MVTTRLCGRGVSMNDEELIEPFLAPEVFVDGFSEHTVRDGVMTCAGYRTMKHGRIVVIRLAWPVVNTIAAIDAAIQAMVPSAAPVKIVVAHPKRGVH